MNVCNVKDGESNFLTIIRHVEMIEAETYWRRLAQYVRAASTSASVIREACGAGVLYDVVAYRHLELDRIR